jgi:hypothetical protein
MRKTIYWLLTLLVLTGCAQGQGRAESTAAAQTAMVRERMAAAATQLASTVTAGPTLPAVTVQSASAQATVMAQRVTPGAQGGMPVTRHSHLTEGPHIQVVRGGESTEAERQQVAAIRTAARAAFEKYQDYQTALADGYQPFAAEVPQDVYHFINPRLAMSNHGSADPLKPSALLYRKVGDGWEWYGVMYSAPFGTDPEKLDAIYPRSLGEWHAHVNICLPPNAGSWFNNLEAAVNDPKFGFEGSIATRAECEAEGGRFYPDVLGWMVHVDLSGDE